MLAKKRGYLQNMKNKLSLTPYLGLLPHMVQFIVYSYIVSLPCEVMQVEKSTKCQLKYKMSRVN